PDLPSDLSDRAQDGWEPLLAVADQAGGDWPRRARLIALQLSAGVEVRDETIGVRLLADIRTIFDGRRIDRIASATLCEALCARDEAPWGDWYGRRFEPRNLAKQLKPYGIASKVIRINDRTPSGYTRDMFEDAWSRYLLPNAASSSTSSTDGQPPI